MKCLLSSFPIAPKPDFIGAFAMNFNIFRSSSLLARYWRWLMSQLFFIAADRAEAGERAPSNRLDNECDM